MYLINMLTGPIKAKVIVQMLTKRPAISRVRIKRINVHPREASFIPFLFISSCHSFSNLNK